MSIIPGTTPTLTLSLDTSISNCTAAEFCLVCENIRILHSLPELQISDDGKEISIRLTQSETLSLPDNRVAKVSCALCLTARYQRQMFLRYLQKNCFTERRCK